MPTHFNGIDHDERCEFQEFGKCLCEERKFIQLTQRRTEVIKGLEEAKNSCSILISDIQDLMITLEELHEALGQ